MSSRAPWLWAALLLPPLVLALEPLEQRAHAVHGNDGFLNYAYARSLLLSADLDFTDDYADFDALQRPHGWRFAGAAIDPATGRPENRYGWGSALLWMPFLIFAHFLAAITPGWTADGLSPPYFFAVRLGTACWGVLGLALLANIARRQVLDDRRGPALFAVLALVFATNLGFYLYLHPSMSMVPAFACAALLLWFLEGMAEGRTFGFGFAVGLSAALLLATRYGDIGFVAGLLPAVAAAHAQGAHWEGGLRRPPAWPAMILGILAVALIQMAIWWYLHGAPLRPSSPYLSADYEWSFPGANGFDLLFSFHHGWLLWHPILLLALAAMLPLCFDAVIPLWLRLTPLAIVGQWLVVSAWPVWHGGASFGNRLMGTALAVAFFGLAMAMRGIQNRWGTRGVLAVLALFSLWNLGLAAQYGLEMIPRQGPVSPLTMLRNDLTLLGQILGTG